MLENIFAKINLKRAHTELYLNLLESGPMPAGSLAKKIQMPRATLYGLLNDLNTKGLVKQSEKNGVKIWQASPPEKISDTLNEQINDFENAKIGFSNILNNLKGKQKEGFVSPKFYYYEGIEGIKHALKDILLYRDLDSEAFWPIKDMLEVLGSDFLNELNKKRIRQNIAAKVIWPKDKTVDINKYPFLGASKGFIRETRIAPPKVTCSMGYWAYKDKVIFLASKKEGFAFIVESAELRQLLKTQFDVLWNISKPLIVQMQATDKFLENL